jgi:hypothetical protein
MADPQATTIVTFLLDQTGSMGAVKPQTIDAFNSYIDELQATPSDIRFTLLLFNSIRTEKVFHNEPIADIPHLTAGTYHPEAVTPLIDAAYKTIKGVERMIAETGADAKVVICIQTDGHENASTEHTWDQLQALIKEKTLAGWQFNFMGCGIDAYNQGRRMGFAAGQTVSYDIATDTTRAAFAAQAVNTMNFARGRTISTGYSDDQKAASGDRFSAQAPKVAKPPEPPKPPKSLADDVNL